MGRGSPGGHQPRLDHQLGQLCRGAPEGRSARRRRRDRGLRDGRPGHHREPFRPPGRPTGRDSLYRHRSGLSLADKCALLWPAVCRAGPTPPTASGRPGRKSSASRSRPSAESERVARPVWEGPSAGLVSREPVHFASGSSRSKPRPFLYGEQSEAKATRDPDLMPALARAAGHVGRATGGSGWVRRMYRSNWGTVKAASP